MPTWDEISPFTEKGTRVRRLTLTNVLIGLNIAGFGAVVLANFLKGDVRDALAFFYPAAAGGWAWQFFTHTFVHPIDPLPSLLWFIIGCYLLYEKGNELERDLGPRRLLALYLGSGVYGAIAHSAYHQAVSEAHVMAYDFYGPIFALLMVHAIRYPQRTTLFLLIVPMRAVTAVWFTGAALFAYCVLFREKGASPAALAGAALFAWAMVRLEPRLDALLESWSSNRERARFVEEVEIRREADRILEKISRTGMESLTAHERRLLKRASRLLQDGREEGR